MQTGQWAAEQTNVCGEINSQIQNERIIGEYEAIKMMNGPRKRLLSLDAEGSIPTRVTPAAQRQGSAGGAEYWPKCATD